SIRMNPDPIHDTTFTDVSVWGDKTYLYQLLALDGDGHESPLTDIVTGHLIQPAPPLNFILGSGPDFIRLNWTPNSEPDLAGYNIFRSTDGVTWVRLDRE